MKRRSFLSMGALAGTTLWLPRSFNPQAMTPGTFQSQGDDKLLIVIELKGGNDGLNTVIPFADPTYYALRKHIGIKREQVMPLDERTALHPSLQPLMPLWRSRQLAIVQGVGYAQPNLSHFRSTQIWDTASRADQYLREGWLTRALALTPKPAGFAAQGLVIGSAEMGPLAYGARGVAVSRPAISTSSHERSWVAAQPKDSVEDTAGTAADRPRLVQRDAPLKTIFPKGAFGNSIETAMQMLARRDAAHVTRFGDAWHGSPKSGRGVAAIRLTLSGFDTHHNQLVQQAALLRQLAEGLASLHSALVELGRWDTTLVMTYGEFGRRPAENESRGTEHGTVAPHFIMGARVRGGLYGMPPTLARLDGNGNLPHGVDFRQLYATVLGPWWGLDASAILQQRFGTLPLLRV